MSSSSPSQYRSVGIVLAVGSGVLIGTSFVFKKKGLLRSQAGHEAGEGVAYLKSVSIDLEFRKYKRCIANNSSSSVLAANVVDWYDQ